LIFSIASFGTLTNSPQHPSLTENICRQSAVTWIEYFRSNCQFPITAFNKLLQCWYWEL